MSSKVSAEVLQEAVDAILEHSLTTKKRNFLETIELQVGLKNYDPNKDKRFSGVLRLPNQPRPNFKVCVIGNDAHCEDAKGAGVDSLTKDDCKAMNRNKKIVKKLAGSYDAFLASSTLIRQIPRLLGPGLNKAGKFPSVITSSGIANQKAELASSVKFQLKSKKTLCLHVPIANVGMTEDEITANVVLSVNFMVSLLTKNWQQIRRIYIKSTMGPSQCIYGMV